MNHKSHGLDPLLSIALLVILLVLMLSTFRAAGHPGTESTVPAHVLYLTPDGARLIAQR